MAVSNRQNNGFKIVEMSHSLPGCLANSLHWLLCCLEKRYIDVGTFLKHDMFDAFICLYVKEHSKESNSCITKNGIRVALKTRGLLLFCGQSPRLSVDCSSAFCLDG